MPDLSHDNKKSYSSTATASERQVWDNLSPNERAQVLGQDIVGEADSSNSNKSVYQKEGSMAYENTPYYSLPPHIQFAVSNRLHELGYFQETYGGNVYEVEGDDQYKCKDCDDIFTSEEDLRVHRKVNHDNNESETESQEAYFRSLEIDPTMTRKNLEWARKVLRGESARQTFPQNDPPVKTEPKLPKGRKEYDDNPNHYFYDNKLFVRGSRNAYRPEGVPLTEARTLIELEDKILTKYGWESTKDVEKTDTNRQVFASEVEKKINVEKLHPHTVKILDNVNKPFLVKTLLGLGAKWGAETQPEHYDDQVKEEPVIHQDYDPEHPHEHNAFDTYFGDKVAEEDNNDSIEDVIAKAPMLNDEQDKMDEEGPAVSDLILKETDGRTCPECGFYTTEELEMDTHQKMHSHDTDHSQMNGIGAIGEDNDISHTGKHTDIKQAVQDKADDPWALANWAVHKHGLEPGASPSELKGETFPFEEEETTVTAEPDLLQNVDPDVMEVPGEEYDPEEVEDKKATEARILSTYTGYKRKGGESINDILEGAIDVPVERETVEEAIYNRKLEGYHEDKIARELWINHGLEYEDAVNKIRNVEVSDDDRVAKTLYGKRMSELNEAEISEMKTLAGEAKRSTGDKYA